MLLTGGYISIPVRPTVALDNALYHLTRGLKDREFRVRLLPGPEVYFVDEQQQPARRGEFVALYEQGEWRPVSCLDIIELMGLDYFKSLRTLELR